jgi:hypothetical protein
MDVQDFVSTRSGIIKNTKSVKNVEKLLQVESGGDEGTAAAILLLALKSQPM